MNAERIEAADRAVTTPDTASKDIPTEPAPWKPAAQVKHPAPVMFFLLPLVLIIALALLTR
jgi:hypothetical protein